MPVMNKQATMHKQNWPKKLTTPAQSGFTLVEILIALFVISVALIAATGAVNQFARQSGDLREKTIAHWVASNVLTELQISRSFPAVGKKDGEVEMADQNWRWQYTITETPNPGLRKIDIEASLDEENSSRALLTGYLGNPAFGLQSITTQ